MKILIAGLAKSGTTALFYSIKDVLGDDTSAFLEREYSPEKVSASTNHNILAKVLTNAIDLTREDMDLFNKHLLIVRDPRDQIISRFLYIMFHRSFVDDEKKRTEYIETIREKEADPSSHSLMSIYRLQQKLEGKDPDELISFLQRSFQRVIVLANNFPEFFILKYEHYVEGQLDTLSDYLGLSLKQGEVAPEYRRVVRTKSSGDWKNWFTEEDVDELKHTVEPFMGRFGYDDWSLNEMPQIDPENGSEYILKLIDDRKAS